MGRKDTLAAKSIRKMYEQLNLNQSDIFSKTKLLLSVYRDVVWITLSESACVNEELVYYGEELNSALVYLELFAPDTEKQFCFSAYPCGDMRFRASKESLI